MTFNIFSTSKNHRGQTLIEFLITFSILILCSWVVIEVSRLIAFKNCLQAATSYVAHKISYSEIHYLQTNVLDTNLNMAKNKRERISLKISSELENYLEKIMTTHFSYDNRLDQNENSDLLYIKKHDIRVYLKLVSSDKKLSSGVYLQTQTCLPVLFSSYFRNFKSKNEIGKTVADDSRSCLGHFHSSPLSPLYWFRVRVAAFSPWPASTEIFSHGLTPPKQFELLEQDNRNNILTAIKTEKLSLFFH